MRVPEGRSLHAVPAVALINSTDVSQPADARSLYVSEQGMQVDFEVHIPVLPEGATMSSSKEMARAYGNSSMASWLGTPEMRVESIVQAVQAMRSDPSALVNDVLAALGGNETQEAMPELRVRITRPAVQRREARFVAAAWGACGDFGATCTTTWPALRRRQVWCADAGDVTTEVDASLCTSILQAPRSSEPCPAGLPQPPKCGWHLGEWSTCEAVPVPGAPRRACQEGTSGQQERTVHCVPHTEDTGCPDPTPSTTRSCQCGNESIALLGASDKDESLVALLTSPSSSREQESSGGSHMPLPAGPAAASDTQSRSASIELASSSGTGWLIPVAIALGAVTLLTAMVCCAIGGSPARVRSRGPAGKVHAAEEVETSQGKATTVSVGQGLRRAASAPAPPPLKDSEICEAVPVVVRVCTRADVEAVRSPTSEAGDGHAPLMPSPPEVSCPAVPPWEPLPFQTPLPPRRQAAPILNLLSEGEISMDGNGDFESPATSPLSPMSPFSPCSPAPHLAPGEPIVLGRKRRAKRDETLAIHPADHAETFAMHPTDHVARDAISPTRNVVRDDSSDGGQSTAWPPRVVCPQLKDPVPLSMLTPGEHALLPLPRPLPPQPYLPPPPSGGPPRRPAGVIRAPRAPIAPPFAQVSWPALSRQAWLPPAPALPSAPW